MRRQLVKLRSIMRRFSRDEHGSVIDTVLVVGVISLPLIMFLAFFGDEVLQWIQKHAPDIFDEASNWLGGGP